MSISITYKELRNLVDKFAIKKISQPKQTRLNLPRTYLKLFKRITHSINTDNFDCTSVLRITSTDSKRNMLMRLMLDESSHFIWNDYEERNHQDTQQPGQ